MRNGYSMLELLLVIVGGFLGMGWCINIWKIIEMSSGSITTELVLRIIGIFAVPFGGIMGWI